MSAAAQNLYSFTPATGSRGGSTLASPPPIGSPRRVGRHSVTGEVARRLSESVEHSTDGQGGPRSPVPYHIPGRSANSLGNVSSSSPPGPASILSRSGSCDRHSYSGGGGGAMPVLVNGAGAAGAPGGMRHAASTGGLVGLPRLDVPPAGTTPVVDVGSPARGSHRRSSVSGVLGGALCEASLSASLDSALAGGDLSASLASPRHNAPAILAPLRAQPLPGTGATVGAAGADGQPAGGGLSHGWCGGSAGGRRGSVSGQQLGPLPVAAAAAGTGGGGAQLTPVPLPVRSSSPVPSPGRGPRPRRSTSMTAAQGPAGEDLPEPLRLAGSSLSSVACSYDYGTSCHPSSSTSDLLASINDDLQQATGALLALHAPACRPRSAAPNAPPPPPPPVTAAQLAALRASAPELHSELRVAVRRAFQVMRQAVAGGGGGGVSPAAASGGRQLGSCVHECWATLDAFLEGTAELTMSLVEGTLAARAAKARGKSRSGAAETDDEEEGEDKEAGYASAGGRSNSSVGGSGGRRRQRGNAKMFKLHDALEEMEQLKAANEELQQQLEESRAALAAVAARGVAVTGDAAGADGGLGAPRGAAGMPGAGPSPRPPSGPNAPPLAGESSSVSSPRRGKHARLQSAARRGDDPDGAADQQLGGDGDDGVSTGASGGEGGDAGGRGGGGGSGPGSPRGERQIRSEPGGSGGGGGGGSNGDSGRLFDRVRGQSRGSARASELVVVEHDSDGSAGDREDGEGSYGRERPRERERDGERGEAGEAEEGEQEEAGFAVPRCPQALRAMLTTHSASFAEWMRGGRRVRPA